VTRLAEIEARPHDRGPQRRKLLLERGPLRVELEDPRRASRKSGGRGTTCIPRFVAISGPIRLYRITF
jgi:hypothetical protein